MIIGRGELPLIVRNAALHRANTDVTRRTLMVQRVRRRRGGSARVRLNPLRRRMVPTRMTS
jgi:hypothetical protein